MRRIKCRGLQLICSQCLEAMFGIEQLSISAYGSTPQLMCRVEVLGFDFLVLYLNVILYTEANVTTNGAEDIRPSAIGWRNATRSGTLSDNGT